MIKKDFVIATLKKNSKELKTAYPIESLELFGSVARNENNANDVDLLLNYNSNFDLFQFMHLKEDLECLLGVKVDLVSSRSLHPIIKTEIEKDLIKII